LRTTPERIEFGEQITLEWETAEETTSNDWIAMYDSDSQDVKSYLSWFWVPSSSQKGSMKVYPPNYGKFIFRYFSNKCYKLWGVSNAVFVGPEYKLEAAKNPSADNQAVVCFEQLSGNLHRNAWIGLYDKFQQDNNRYIDFKYLAHTNNLKLTFDIPKYGEYEFRLFPERPYFGSYVDVKRCDFDLRGKDELKLEQVGPKIKITGKLLSVDPYTDSAWVGVFFVSEGNNKQWRRYKYLYSSNVDIEFKTLQHSGTYEARVLAQKSYDKVVCRSNPITITV